MFAARGCGRWVIPCIALLAACFQGAAFADDNKKDADAKPRALPQSTVPPQSAAQSPSAPPPAQPVQPTPSGRVARNIAVITIEGPLDEWTVYSVRRRIAKAQEQGADAIVFDINSPGGELTAFLLISAEIKKSPIPTTVAWVNPMAYSGGAVIALACREIVVNDGAVLGDALPIRIDMFRKSIEASGADERAKMAAPIIADLIDSARQNHYDEMLVQGIVRRGVELWLIENPETGERLFVNEAQYRVAVGVGGGEPSRLSPSVASGLEAPTKPRRGRRELPPLSPRLAEKTDFIPAEKNATPSLAGDVNAELAVRSVPSLRPNLEDAEHKGKYVPVEYVSDGTGILTMRQTELMRYGIARAKVRSDAELKQYFGATNLARLDENWADHAARFLSIQYVKIFLIVVFLVALFVEMTHPGLSLPGGIAAVALVCLVLPPILAGIAGWWTLAAIVAGIGLVCVEIFVTPGVAIVGIIGVLLLFFGLAGTFLVGPGGVGGGGGLFPGSGRSGAEIAWAVVTTLVSLLIAGVVIGVLMRFLPQMPLFRRLILTDAQPDESGPGAYTTALGPDHPIKPGMKGVAITPLRPAGRVQIGERIVDAVTDGSFVEAGEPVRVTSASGFRTSVVRDRS